MVVCFTCICLLESFFKPQCEKTILDTCDQTGPKSASYMNRSFVSNIGQIRFQVSLDWPRPRGRGFEPNQRHCVVSLSKTY